MIPRLDRIARWKTVGRVGCALLLVGVGVFVLRRPEESVARVEIFKARRELQLVSAAGRVLRSYPVGLGSSPVASKEVEGDGATPEGTYFICRRNPESRFYLSLGISYPGPRDAARGRAAGLISEAEERAIREAHERGETPPWKTPLGGEIFIHGRGSGADWTQGCVAVEDAAMDELYARIPLGTPVVIHP